jgi:hypothetical protein
VHIGSTQISVTVIVVSLCQRGGVASDMRHWPSAPWCLCYCLPRVGKYGVRSRETCTFGRRYHRRASMLLRLSMTAMVTTC